VWMFVFTGYYRISGNIKQQDRVTAQPYLLLSNHFGRYDPFIISYFLEKPPNFISSDAILRDKIIGTLFKGLGAIPKKKGVRDTLVIREMVKVVRTGGALALFPEGTRTWTGSTSYIEPSIAKLIKLLNVQVFTARMKGAYAFDPRWARFLRRARVEIDYENILEPEEIQIFPEDKILSILRSKLQHDDVEYQLQHMIPIRSHHRAEYIDRVLFQCPVCQSFSGFVARKNIFTCKGCGDINLVDRYGFFRGADNSNKKFTNIRDWLAWQNNNFSRFIRQHYLQSNQEELFGDTDLKVQMARGNDPMANIGLGSLHFFIDRIEISLEDKREILLLRNLVSIGPQFNERIELFYEDRAYRFVDTRTRVAGLKWELAVNEIWHLTGEDHKLSTYLKNTMSS
jgi:1-acyl-sn-glycerol-3-phosphate acyltransferase